MYHSNININKLLTSPFLFCLIEYPKNKESWFYIFQIIIPLIIASLIHFINGGFADSVIYYLLPINIAMLLVSYQIRYDYIKESDKHGLSEEQIKEGVYERFYIDIHSICMLFTLTTILSLLYILMPYFIKILIIGYIISNVLFIINLIQAEYYASTELTHIDNPSYMPFSIVDVKRRIYRYLAFSIMLIIGIFLTIL